MFMIVYGYLCLQHFNMNLLKKAAGAGENPEPQRLWMKKAFLTYNTQGSRGWGSHLRELLSMQRPGKCALSGFQLSPAIWGSYRELRFDSHCHSWPYLLINTHKPSCSFPYLMLRHILVGSHIFPHGSSSTHSLFQSTLWSCGIMESAGWIQIPGDTLH